MGVKFEVVVGAVFLAVAANPVAVIGSLIFIVYYLSKIKLEIVNIHYKNSWWLYIKSFFKFKSKK